jgi:50S ribosomal subunit-associated GTPase HflX
MGEWIDGIHSTVGEAPVIVLANKKDMTDHIRVEEDDILALCEVHAAPFLLTSARTGENVEVAFTKLAEMAVRSRFGGEEKGTEPEAPDAS